MPLFKLPEQDIWRDIQGYENLYKVNRNGEVMRVGGSVITKRGHVQKCPSKILKPYQGQVYLSKDGKVSTVRVCNIVAETFLEGYQPGSKVYHIEGNSDALSNLSLIPVLNEYQEDDDWRFIPGTRNLYQASIYGEIRSVDRVSDFEHYGKIQHIIHEGRILKLHKHDDGYLHCLLSVDGKSEMKSVHRLVAITFIPNPDNKPDVNHIDGNKTNNAVTNLEWVTKSENMQHAIKNNLWDPVSTGYISRQTTGIPVICIDDNNRRFESLNSAASYYHMDKESVKESIRLNRPRKGHVFKYADKCEVSE